MNLFFMDDFGNKKLRLEVSTMFESSAASQSLMKKNHQDNLMNIKRVRVKGRVSEQKFIETSGIEYRNEHKKKILRYSREGMMFLSNTQTELICFTMQVGGALDNAGGVNLCHQSSHITRLTADLHFKLYSGSPFG